MWFYKMNNKYTKHQMNIPGLAKLRTIGATSEDMKIKVNELQKEIRKHTLAKQSLQNEANLLIIEIDKIEKTEEYLR